jgi:hypothetical protein
MQETWDDVWDVERSEEAAGTVRVSLVRRREHRFSKHLVAHSETVERTVLFSRSFRPLFETVAIEHYAAQLELVARHAREGHGRERGVPGRPPDLGRPPQRGT